MYEFVNWVVRILKKIVPASVVRPLRSPYHAALTFLMTVFYGFPARKLTAIGITGTKGKSTVAEMAFSILRAAGYKTALISTIRFAIEDDSEPNRYKMTLQGRGFVQAFMRRALKAGCTHLVIEVTSESVLQYRHWFLDLDGLIVTNIQREHIEHHGSFEKYVAAKRAIVTTLEHSPKRSRILVANADVPSRAFLSAEVPQTVGFSEHELQNFFGDEKSVSFEYAGMRFSLPLSGVFNAMNALSAIKLCEAFGVPLSTAADALKTLPVVRGRVEHIDAGQDFIAIVDYAHTPDSLRALYGAFKNHRKICVLGNTGGGRDTWKRPEMGHIADEACEKVILTNEDPYDENPKKIVEAMANGMKRAPEIIMDRREAIRAALCAARSAMQFLLPGKVPTLSLWKRTARKTPWSDAGVVREELERLIKKV